MSVNESEKTTLIPHALSKIRYFFMILKLGATAKTDFRLGIGIEKYTKIKLKYIFGR